MFLAGSDLTPLKENIDSVVYGLTKWAPKVTAKGVLPPPPKLTVQGKDYQESVANMNLLFLRNMWADGLPLLPATAERVNWILTGTDLSRDTKVGLIMPRGNTATVETFATALAMAGGRPEYLPVLLAIGEGICVPEFWTRSWNSTTNNPTPVVVVNGPIAKQLRINSNYGCLGPSPLFPAGATIGRALRLILMNVGGAIPGLGTMAIHGLSARYTNIIFAEDEEGLPKKGWVPLNVERGFPPGSNTITLHVVLSEVTFSSIFEASTDETGLKTLQRMAWIIRTPGLHQGFGKPYNPEGTPGILLLARGTAAGFGNRGWSKDDVKKWLWEKTTLTPSEVIQYGMEGTTLGGGTKYPATKLPAGSPLPQCVAPKNIMIVVAGGMQSGHSFWMGTMTHTEIVQSKEIKLPATAKWDALLKQAETDLGPIPVIQG